MVEQSDTLHPGATRTGALRWWALGVLSSAFFLVLLDATIVYVALPRLQRDLGFSVGDVHWVMTAYLLSFGGLLLLGGRLAEAVGARRMLLVGAATFVAGSGLAAAAWSPAPLLAGRAVQGIGAALLAPTTLPLLVRAFDQVQGRRRALGVWTAIGVLTGTAGLLIGGPLTDSLGWRSVFLVNLPLGVALLVLAPLLLPAEDSGRPARRHVDIAGAVALTAALALVTAAIAEAGGANWAVVAGLAGGAVLAFAAFAVIEVHATEPLLPLYLLRLRRRGGGILVLLCAGLAVDGASLLLALYLQGVRGYSATMFGLVMTVMTLSSVIASFAGQALVTRRGLTPVAATSLAVTAIGLVVLAAVLVDGGLAGAVPLGLLALGSGLGAAFVSGQIAVVAGAVPTDSLPASGLADATFSVGGALGLAVMSTILAHGRPAVPGQVPAAGYRPAFLAAAALTVLGLAATLLLRRRRVTPVDTGAVPQLAGACPVLPSTPVGLPRPATAPTRGPSP